MARPISIWMSEEEEAMLKKKAKEDKRTISNYCKIKIFKEIKNE
jgi:hypothetical protein